MSDPDYDNMSVEELQKIARGDADHEFDNMSEAELERLANPPGMIESGLRGAAQGATLGFADEIAGGAEALFTKKPYEQARDESRANFKRAKDANPGTYTTGEIGGGVATALVPGLNAVKGARGMIGLGAAMGGVAGVGGSEADNAQDMALDFGKGAGLGAAGGAAGYGLSKAVPWAAKTAGEKLKWLAEKSAVNATGATGKQAGKFAPGAGRELLDRGIVRFGDTSEKIAERAGDAVDDAGAAIKSALAGLDEKGATASADNVVAALNQKIESLRGDPSKAGVVKKLESMINDIIETGNSNVPVGAAEETKRGFNKMAGNWLDPDAGEAGKAAYGAYKNEVERAALAADPSLAGKFTDAKQSFGLLEPIREAAAQRAASAGQSHPGGLKDLASIGVGLATGGAPGAVAAPLASRLAAPRISSSVAVASDKVSKFLLKSPKMQQLARTNPPAFRSMAQALSSRVSYGGAMPAAAQFDPTKPADEQEAKQNFVNGN